MRRREYSAFSLSVWYKRLGIATTLKDGEYYPTVGLEDVLTLVVNFGDRQFSYETKQFSKLIQTTEVKEVPTIYYLLSIIYTYFYIDRKQRILVGIQYILKQFHFLYAFFLYPSDLKHPRDISPISTQTRYG